jgi:hypothetical protein
MASIIEVFRTNIDSETIAQAIKAEINTMFPELSVNFDLDDSDHIMRLVTPSYDYIPQVAAFVTSNGYECEVLPD